MSWLEQNAVGVQEGGNVSVAVVLAVAAARGAYLSAVGCAVAAAMGVYLVAAGVAVAAARLMHLLAVVLAVAAAKDSRGLLLPGVVYERAPSCQTQLWAAAHAHSMLTQPEQTRQLVADFGGEHGCEPHQKHGWLVLGPEQQWLGLQPVPMSSVQAVLGYGLHQRPQALWTSWPSDRIL